MMALLIGKIHDGSRQNGMIWRHAMGAVPQTVVAVLYEPKIK
jgi:hypothetical protein